MKITYGELKISYPLIAKLIRNYAEISLQDNFEVAQCFSWSKTPQGAGFWENIQTGQFYSAKIQYPNLFISLKDILKQL